MLGGAIFLLPTATIVFCFFQTNKNKQSTTNGDQEQTFKGRTTKNLRGDRSFVLYFSSEEKKQCFNEQMRSLKYESVNDDAKIEGDRLSTKLRN